MNGNTSSAINWLRANLRSTTSSIFNIEEKNGKIVIVGNILIPSDIEELPYKIDEVFGNVTIDNICEPIRLGKLKSFKNFPTVVHGDFTCKKNPGITSLEGCPEQVNGDFSCIGCNLTSLNYMPKKVKGNFIVYNNNINDMSPILESTIGGLIDIQFNPCENSDLYLNLRLQNRISEIR